ncbi:MAG: GspE/PulE family protein [Fibrobacter sp.]|jgi:type II secretory ATPase GspE/PulE/Tfp pilus assembly ATPase PilB-like protein|nr:GspE/PulE family protein [Fibrobacter sp.]
MILDHLDNPPPVSCLRLFPPELMKRYSVFPFAFDEESGVVSVAMSDCFDFDLIAELQAVSGLWVMPAKAKLAQIAEWIDVYASHSSRVKAVSSGVSKGSSSAVRMVDEILSEAMHSGASDIHFEPGEREFLVRFRKDGVLTVVRRLPVRSVAEILSRIKIMSGLDIAERRRPQDGRIHFSDGSREVDIRVSALPTDYGQKVVLRLLDKGNVIHDLDALGMLPEHVESVEKEIRKPYGMFLVTGPTGSGKTTTLYTLLQMIRSSTINISTIEEPIEYKIPGIIQTAVNPKIDLTFASALRTLLRQDPDVIMVGEIRDSETAELAIRAALTGHLVFSTLHTNDAPSAIVRLIDMGIEPFLLASALNLVMAQRLVRRVCSHCHGETTEKVRCVYCGGSGFRGRLAIYEMMPMSEQIRELVHSGSGLADIREAAKKEGMATLAEDGAKKVALNWTTEAEVASEAMGD